jgi:hypothetical protein
MSLEQGGAGGINPTTHNPRPLPGGIGRRHQTCVELGLFRDYEIFCSLPPSFCFSLTGTVERRILKLLSTLCTLHLLLGAEGATMMRLQYEKAPPKFAPRGHPFHVSGEHPSVHNHARIDRQDKIHGRASFPTCFRFGPSHALMCRSRLLDPTLLFAPDTFLVVHSRIHTTVLV